MCTRHTRWSVNEKLVIIKMAGLCQCYCMLSYSWRRRYSCGASERGRASVRVRSVPQFLDPASQRDCSRPLLASSREKVVKSDTANAWEGLNGINSGLNAWGKHCRANAGQVQLSQFRIGVQRRVKLLQMDRRPGHAVKQKSRPNWQ